MIQRNPSCWFRPLLLLGTWLVVGGTASAGGAYLPRTGTADSVRQRAVLVLEGNTTTLLLQSGFSGNASELAWVVPVTGIGAAQQISLRPDVSGQPGMFERLHDQSAPRVIRLVEKRKSFGCSSEGVTFTTPTEIQPFEGMSASDQSFFPLDGQLSSDILDWLAGANVGTVCPDLATSCAIDEDCGRATVCQDGFCTNQIYECGTDADCNADVECFNFMCVNLTPTCGSDADCGGDVSCRNDYCLRLTPTCGDDTDCGGLIEYSGMCLGSCSEAGTACTDISECPTDETCDFTCAGDTENAGDTCSGDGDCGRTQCGVGTCGDGSSCSSDEECGGVTECRSGECYYDPAAPGSKRSCDEDEDCFGLIACINEYCEHTGHPCQTADDCGGLTECTSHCLNRRVDCSEDVDCDMICVNNKCRDSDQVPVEDRRFTDAFCDGPFDCTAVDECQTFNVNGTDVSLCTNQAPYCSNGSSCNTTCQENPFGSGNFTCGGSYSEIPCTGDGPCQASIECQQGICVNRTRTCTTDPNCSTTCERPASGEGAFDLGVICESDDDCASGRCEYYEGVWACTRACSLPNDPCPTSTARIRPPGFDCVRSNDQDFCWPRDGAVEPGTCGGSDYGCTTGSDCTAATECGTRTPDPAYPVSAEQEAWLTQYANEGAKFAVTKLRGVTSATGDDLLPPLAIQLGGNVPEVPLRTVGADLDLELYVIAHERYRPINFSYGEVLIDQFFDGGDFDEWYAEQLEQSFAASSAPEFLVEYADVIESQLVDFVLGRPANVAQVGARDWFLTKLRARFSAGELDRDLRLTPDGDRRFVIRAVGNGRVTDATLGGFAVFLAVGWSAWRIRRRR